MPSLTQFNPKHIQWQHDATKLVRRDYDYSRGSLELLLSGSVGSAKSLWMAHIAVTHCLMFPNAEVIIGRMAMPHLKQTILQTIINHIEEVPHKLNLQSGIITFENGSRMIPISWQDKKFKKVRSYQPSAIIVEELTENDTNDAYRELRMRLGRRPDIPESFMIMATNPDSPAHWAHEEIIQKQNYSRRVIYSITEQNPFLPDTYISSLKETLSEKECRRMIYGEWIDLVQEVVYWNYLKERNFVDESYKFKPRYPIDLCFDFNIGVGKPMSAGTGQFDGVFHCAKDYVVHGARTLDIMEEMAGDGVFDMSDKFRIFGDATGKNRDTRSLKSDYDIILKFIQNYSSDRMINVEMCVPKANPPIKERHNLSNAAFFNANNHKRVAVYKDADFTDKGFRLTKLVKSGRYIEDDSDEWQHITTARTYWFHYIDKFINSNRKSNTIQL